MRLVGQLSLLPTSIHVQIHPTDVSRLGCIGESLRVALCIDVSNCRRSETQEETFPGILDLTGPFRPPVVSELSELIILPPPVP